MNASKSINRPVNLCIELLLPSAGVVMTENPVNFGVAVTSLLVVSSHSEEDQFPYL